MKDKSSARVAEHQTQPDNGKAAGESPVVRLQSGKPEVS
jgi:hypothetical protein